MTGHDTWEAATLDLIRRLESDRLHKAEQRLLTAQRAVATVKSEIDALHVALKVYRAEHGIPADEMPEPDERDAAAYRGLGGREMLQRWASLHGGQVVMRDAARFLTAAGLFRDETQAAGALYPAATRGDEFEKVSRGVYRRVTAQPTFRLDENESPTPDEPDEPEHAEVSGADAGTPPELAIAIDQINRQPRRPERPSWLRSTDGGDVTDSGLPT